MLIGNLQRLFIDSNLLVGESMRYSLGKDEAGFESRGENISIPMQYFYNLNAQEINSTLRMAATGNIKTGDRPAFIEAEATLRVQLDYYRLDTLDMGSIYERQRQLAK